MLSALAIALLAATTFSSGPSTQSKGFATIEALQSAYHQAVKDENEARLGAMYFVRTEWESKMVRAYVQNDINWNRLRKADEKEFGVVLPVAGRYMPQDLSQWHVINSSATVPGQAANRRYPPLRRTGE